MLLGCNDAADTKEQVLMISVFNFTDVVVYDSEFYASCLTY